MTGRKPLRGLRRWGYSSDDPSEQLFFKRQFFHLKTASAPDSFFTATLAEADPEIADAIRANSAGSAMRSS